MKTLEDHITNFSLILEDLDAIMAVSSDPKITETIQSLRHLYSIKFDMLWESFEESLRTKKPHHEGEAEVPDQVWPGEKLEAFQCTSCGMGWTSYDYMVVQESFHYGDTGGYNSPWGDGTKWETTLCPECTYDTLYPYAEVE